MLAAEIQEALATVSEKIGEVRAVIALQAVLHKRRPLRIIDGKISRETLEAVSVVGAAIGTDKLAAELLAHVEARFPEEFGPERDENATVADLPAEDQPERVEKKKRRRRTP